MLGEQSLQALDRGVFAPSRLDEARRRELRARFSALHFQTEPQTLRRLEFRFAPALDANAFTLTDGSIIVLDELAERLSDDEVIAVLAHELGHVDGRHPLRLLIQGSALAAFWALYAGDVSSLLAAAPAAVLQAHYSRTLEQQADDYGAGLLRANELSPGLLADALEKLDAAQRHGTADFTGGYLSSHAGTALRIEHLRALATATSQSI